YAEPDLRSPIRDFLPRHSAVVVGRSGLMTRGTDYAALDTGAFLPLPCLSPRPPVSADLVAAAELYLGCPYLWAGRSMRGLDCSALVQNAFRDLGITVARDTDQQRDTIGARVTAEAIEELRRGDLLYMPGHVLIFAGGDRFIHADGATMAVRHDHLVQWLTAYRLALSDFVIRRPDAIRAEVRSS
ncbi:MAG: C40 family peptidase, partial [Alphaproteobacteria bacterium]|nr:C40 family peptidase [Alphaproteobacteria bacterium]